ncbi:MAG: transglutaminase domain-containing protein [Candidatus Hadarchaeales archaeon]
MKGIAVFTAALILLLLPTAAAEEAAIYTVKMNYEMINAGGNEAMNVRATIYLFDNISGWAEQTIISEEILLEGALIFPHIFEGAENRWTTIEVGDLKPGERKVISATQVIKVKSVGLSIEPSNVGSVMPPEVEELTEPVPGLFESDDPRIQQLAMQLTSGITNPYLKLERILRYVAENLVYERQTEEHGALWALLNGKGDCTEFSNLMIALARAAGIPAKAVVGYAYLPIYEENPQDTLSLGHEYAIFYMPGYGWVPADAVWPRYGGTVGKTDHYRIAGIATDGRGVVSDQGRISWPGPGYLHREWNYVSGRPTNVTGETSMELQPDVLIRLDLNAGGSIENDMLPLQMTIKNAGRRDVENLRVEFDVDVKKFQVMEPLPEIDRLAGGEEITLSHSVRVLENGYGSSSTLSSTVTFDPVYQGAKGFSTSATVSVNISPKPELPVSLLDPLLLAVGIGVVLGGLIGALIAAKR